MVRRREAPSRTMTMVPILRDAAKRPLLRMRNLIEAEIRWQTRGAQL
jgi:hypothetical protein